MHRLILRSNQCPGDVVVMTAAVRELHRQYPGQYQTDVRTCAPALWEHNPHITPIADGDKDARTIEMHYPLINQSNQRPVHFLEGYCEFLAAELGLASLRPQEFRGHIYLSDEERVCRSQVEETAGYRGAFWLVNAGSKNDYTCKQWPLENFQAVIDHFRGRITFVQIGASEHNHAPLSGVIDLRGKTDHRQLIRLVYHSSGVLTGVSYPMHLAAAVPVKGFGVQGSGFSTAEAAKLPLPSGEGRGGGRRVANHLRPCVVLNGGREPPHWEQYPGHQFLHTIGALDCCATGGCWKSRVVRLGDGDHKDRDLCHQPVAGSPRCMRLITPDDVIRAIELYEGSGFGVQGSGGKEIANRELQIANCKSEAGNAAIEDVAKAQDLRPKTQGPNPKSKIQNPKSEVLIDFRHGLGDAVQLTTVLLHLRHYHPDWQIDIAAGIGKHSCYEGLCRDAFVAGSRSLQASDYRQVFTLGWHECPTSYADGPSTKAEYCLRTVFGLPPVAELCRYRIACSNRAQSAARRYLETICPMGVLDNGRWPAVLIHYQGNTSRDEKDLPHEVVRAVCDEAKANGLVPVVLDWDNRSPLIAAGIANPGASAPLWGGSGTGDAETLAALIGQSCLMIAIDSGPLHVAAATDTPTIAVWTRHHPLHYLGHAEHVRHLLPTDHAKMIRGEQRIGLDYFNRHYSHEVYSDLKASLLKCLCERLDPTPAGLVFRRNFWIRRQTSAQDLVIVEDVAERDCYRLAEMRLPGPVLVDVGAHLGAFSLSFHRRHPSARIVAVECCPENIDVLRRNVSRVGSVVQAAVTYETDVALLNAVYEGCASTGGSTLVSRSELAVRCAAVGLSVPGPQPDLSPHRRLGEYWADTRPIKTLTLEEIMADYGLPRIDVLKLDCEGSEFSILENAAVFDRVGLIVGEYHDRERFLELVARRFADWKLEIIRDGNPGTFWLANPHPPHE